MALATSALTTVSALEAEMGITPSSTGTTLALLERAINAASASIAAALGRELHHAERIERVAGHGTPQLLTRVTPLRSIALIEYLGADDPEEIDAADYEIADASAGLVRRHCATWRWTGRVTSIDGDLQGGSEQLLYRVTYTGGWITPEQEGGALVRDLPYDIEDAALRLSALLYRSRGRDESVKSRKLMSASVTYGATQAAQADILAPIVSTYRRLVL
jgi:hypothetical protein